MSPNASRGAGTQVRHRSGAGVTPHLHRLSPIQHRIVDLLAQGASDDRVANSLGIGLRTVQRHMSCIMRELGVRSRFEAGVAIARAGWLDEGRGDCRVATRHRPAGPFPDASSA
jgi:DNA-binding NarL/FixJ family response regulator